MCNGAAVLKCSSERRDDSSSADVHERWFSKEQSHFVRETIERRDPEIVDPQTYLNRLVRKRFRERGAEIEKGNGCDDCDQFLDENVHHEYEFDFVLRTYDPHQTRCQRYLHSSGRSQAYITEIVVERRSVSPPRSSESPGRPQLVTVKKQDLNRSLTMPVYKPTGVPPVAAPYHLSESDLPKDAVPDIPQIPAKHPKDLPKLRAPFLRLPSIDESAFEPFRQNFRKSKSQLSSPSDTESPTSDTKDSRLSITTVATSLYSPEDDGPMPTDSMELPLHFHPDSDGEDTIVCGLPCTDPHRAQELQYTLDVLTGECPRRIDEEAIAMQDIIMGKKLGSNVAVKRAPVPQPVKPSGLVGMFAGAKERKKMEMQLLRRFKGEKTTAQRQKRKIL